MKKKLLSLLLVIAVMMTSVSMGFGSLVAIAGAVGEGVESIKAFSLIQNGEATGTTFNTTITIKSNITGYQIKVNSIVPTIRYHQDETNVLQTVTVDPAAVGKVCGTGGETFSVTGTILSGKAGLIRYECNYDLLDSSGNTVYSGMTGYGFGAVSANGQQTGALGTNSSEPPRPGDRYYFGHFDVINSLYVQTPSIVLTSNQETSENAIAGASSQNKAFTIASGTAPSTITLRNLEWEYVEMYGSGDVTTTWFEMNSMPNGHFSFTLNYDGSKYHDVEMYYRSDDAKAKALNLYNEYIGKGAEKSYYTSESWEYYLEILEKTAIVAMAIPGPNYAFDRACTYADAAATGEALAAAYNALVPLPGDDTALKNTYNDFVAVKDSIVLVKTYEKGAESLGDDTMSLRLYLESETNAIETKYDSYKIPSPLYKYDQPVVDGYTAELSNMIANLNYSNAIYTYLDVAIEEYESLAETQRNDVLYTNVSWADYESAANNAKNLSRSLKADKQGDINTCLEKLVSAKNSLVLLDADIIALKEQIEIATPIFDEYDQGKLFSSTEGFDELWEYFEGLYNDAVKAQSYKKDRQAEVDDITRRLSIINRELEKYRVLDTTALQAVLILEPEYEQSKYVESSYNTWHNLRVEGYTFLAKTQLSYTGSDRKSYADIEEMNRLIELIQNAYDNLEKVKADFTELDGYIAQIPSEDILALYKQECVDAIRDVVKTIDYGATFEEQDEVDQIALDLKNALDALTYENYKGADYSGVEAAIAKAESLNSSDYENFNIVEEAIAAVDWTKKIIEQDDVDEMEEAIRDAISSLGFIPANYDDVDAAIDEANGIENIEWYVNYYRVQDIINSIDRNLTIDDQEIVDGYAAAIREAIKDLKLAPADYTKVNEAINAAHALEPLSDFNDEYVERLDEAVSGVEAGYTKDRQAEVDAMAERINVVLADAEANLNPADYTRLNTAVAYAESKNTTGEYKNYDEVVKPVIEAINRDLNCRQTAEMQAQIDAVYAAVEKLEYKDADYSKVTEAIENAQNLYADNDYAEFPYSQESIDAVEDVIGNIDWTHNIKEQDKVDAYVVAINKAVANLKYAPADYSEVYAAKERYDNLQRDLYVSLSEVDSYVAKINWNYTVKEKEMVAAIAAELNSMLDNLEYAPADYTRIINAKNEFEDIKKNSRNYYEEEDIAAVQAALDAVGEYNLSKEHQSEVDAMADEVESALSNLKANMKSADLTELLKAKKAAEDKYAEMQQSGYEIDMNTYLPLRDELVKVNRYDSSTKIKDQDAVDALTAAIIAATANLEYKFQIIWDDSGLITEGSGKEGEGSFIYGFEEGTTSEDASELLNFVGAAELKIYETLNGFGTGTTIKFVSTKDGSTLAEYTVIVFGDANGDAVVDTFDYSYLIEVVNTIANVNAATLKAIDLDNSGWLDADDVTKMSGCANMIDILKQDGTMETYPAV